MAVFKPTEGGFLIKAEKSEIGSSGYIPVCGDWDGDGFVDVAV